LNIENVHSEEIQQNAIAKQKVYMEMLDLKREEYFINSEIKKSSLLLQDENQLKIVAEKT
jgi:hypothetical protein